MKEWLAKFWCEYQDGIMYYSKKILLALLVVVLAWICIRALTKLIKKVADKAGNCDVASERLIQISCRYGVGFFAVLIILDLLGINTASLLTLLGTAGLAIGLALKNTLSNMAAGLVLLITRPYNPGDYIEGAKINGTVEKMGLFTSVLRTADGSAVSLPNNLLWAGAVVNYSRCGARRAELTVTASYSADVDKDIDKLSAILAANEKILNVPAPQVVITDFDDSKVTLKISYWSAKSDYVLVFCDVKRNMDAMLAEAGFGA